MQRSSSGRSSGPLAAIGRPGTCASMLGVASHRIRPSGVNGMRPSGGSITSDVCRPGPTLPFCVSSQTSFSSPLRGTARREGLQDLLQGRSLDFRRLRFGERRLASQRRRPLERAWVSDCSRCPANPGHPMVFFAER